MGSRYDEVYARGAAVTKHECSGRLGRSRPVGLRAKRAQHANRQIANIAARLERLPLTSYQRGIFAIIATAWFVDSMDLGALTFVLGSIRQTFQLSTAEAGLLSSMSFLGMFLGAASAGLLADRFGRAQGVSDQHDLLGARQPRAAACHRRLPCSAPRACCSASAWAWSFRSRNRWCRRSSRPSSAAATSRYLEGFWPLGFIASGLLIYFVLSVAEWHWVFILQAIPALFVLVDPPLRAGIAALARLPRPFRPRRTGDG